MFGLGGYLTFFVAGPSVEEWDNVEEEVVILGMEVAGAGCSIALYDLYGSMDSASETL